MTVPPTFTEVAVFSEDGRSERLGTLHHWEKRNDGWWGHCKVFQDGGGQRWETVPAERLIELVYCGRLPDGGIMHSHECRPQPET